MRKRARLTDENDPLTQTDQVLAGFEQVKKLESQKADKSGSQKAENLTAQQVSLPESPIVDKLILKKATFQFNSEILQQLDKLHLRMQMERGKAETPYKEVIVEEAIARFLAEINDNESQILQDLNARQKIRDL
jgi:hypothetical protein